jgi:hypothetical protein
VPASRMNNDGLHSTMEGLLAGYCSATPDWLMEVRSEPLWWAALQHFEDVVKVGFGPFAPSIRFDTLGGEHLSFGVGRQGVNCGSIS